MAKVGGICGYLKDVFDARFAHDMLSPGLASDHFACRLIYPMLVPGKSRTYASVEVLKMRCARHFCF